MYPSDKIERSALKAVSGTNVILNRNHSFLDVSVCRNY